MLMGVSLASVAAGLALTNQAWQIYPVLAAIALGCLALSGLRYSSLIVLHMWVASLVHLLKRAVFLIGDQSQEAYYSVLLLPTVILIPALVRALPRVGPSWRLVTTRLMIAFVGWSAFVSLVSTSDLPLAARLAAIHQRVLPMAAFIVGLATPPGSREFRRVVSALVWSAVVSVAYGAWMFLAGPTALERAWAAGTASYSIQGEKTMSMVAGESGLDEWRGFSYYADPLTWGLYLVAAMAGLLILRSLGQGPRNKVSHSILVALVIGLILCLTRTPWLGLLVMLAAYVLLRWRPAQNVWCLAAMIPAGFLLVVQVGSYCYSSIGPLMPSVVALSPIARRYLTVGTIEARIGAWDAFRDLLSQHPFLGEGFAYNEHFAQALAGRSIGDPASHNFLVETIVCAGIPGLALLIWFLLALLRDGSNRLRQTHGSASMRWLVAFTLGYVMTGYLNGGAFLNHYFFFLTGSMVSAFPKAPRH